MVSRNGIVSRAASPDRLMMCEVAICPGRCLGAKGTGPLPAPNAATGRRATIQESGDITLSDPMGQLFTQRSNIGQRGSGSASISRHCEGNDPQNCRPSNGAYAFKDLGLPRLCAILRDLLAKKCFDDSAVLMSATTADVVPQINGKDVSWVGFAFPVRYRL